MPWLLMFLGLNVGCVGSRDSKPPSDPTLTVAAAADLQTAFTEIARLFERSASCRVSLTFGSTGQLAQQIASGLPVDLFAAANLSYIDSLDAQGLIEPGTRRIYGRGHIVLVAQRGRGSKIKQLEDLLSTEVKHIAIANPAHAPYGAAARQALERVGLWEQLQPKIVLGENVRQAIQYVETGNAEAGIVALSIASGTELSINPIDESLHEPIEQGLGIIAGTSRIELARQFVEFLNGPEARAVMTRCGFVVPNRSEPD